MVRIHPREPEESSKLLAFELILGKGWNSAQADDAVIHRDTKAQARSLWAALAERLGSLGLALHPDKTKVVFFCKDTNRPGRHEATSFDFLGYTSRARLASGRRGFVMDFSPAMRVEAEKAKSGQIRGWHLKRRSDQDLASLAKEINSQVRGWFNYHGLFYRSELHSLAQRIDQHLVRWAMHKFKHLRGNPRRAWAWLMAVRQREPTLFAHWQLVSQSPRRLVGAR